MPTDRTVYRYYFKVGRKIVHIGITGDIDIERYELQQKHNGKGRITQIGFRTTYEDARAWEAEELKKHKIAQH